jgi:hypothetical protein
MYLNNYRYILYHVTVAFFGNNLIGKGAQIYRLLINERMGTPAFVLHRIRVIHKKLVTYFNKNFYLSIFLTANVLDPRVTPPACLAPVVKAPDFKLSYYS